MKRNVSFFAVILGILLLCPPAFGQRITSGPAPDAAATQADPGGIQTVKLDSLPADLRGQLLAKQAEERGRVEPGLHATEDGSTFLYGGPVPAASRKECRPFEGLIG